MVPHACREDKIVGFLCRFPDGYNLVLAKENGARRAVESRLHQLRVGLSLFHTFPQP